MLLRRFTSLRPYYAGPKKGAILQALVEQLQPRVAVEVGTLAGYSALLIAQRLPPGGRLVSYEKDLQWSLVAKRFMSQASQGRDASRRPGNKVEVVWGEACGQLAKWASRRPAGGQQIELLLLDGTPKETLDYLKAAEPHLAPGAVVVADNAVVFAQGGMAPYLQYVRGSPQYSTALVASTLEWRDDVEDGMEVSVYQGRTSGGKTAADLVASVAALPSSPSSAAGIETAATTVAGPPNAAAASVGAAKPST